MALDTRLLRKFFAVGAAGATLVAAGFYLRGIVHAWHEPSRSIPAIAPNIKEIATGFKFTKSEGDKKLFTIQAAKTRQFKDAERYQLQDASIILYGKNGGRSDQIHGSDFQYDKDAGEVTAQGEVQIDLQADSPVPGLNGSVPQDSKSVIHLKTSGLAFNENSGLAQTEQRIQFQVSGAEGSAVGATYDSRANLLTLKSAVMLTTTGERKANITGRTATIVRSPDRVILEGAKIEQPPRILETEKLTVLLRADGTVEEMLAHGAVHAGQEGAKGFEITAPEGELKMDAASQPRSATLSGGVSMSARGGSPSEGKAGRMLFSFGSKGKLEKMRAEEAVDFRQRSATRSQQIQAAALDLYVRDGKLAQRAETSAGPAQVVLVQGAAKSTISAGSFQAKFAGQNRLKSVYGSSGATVVSVIPGRPDRITHSRDITATFNAKGEIASAEQDGDFRYREADWQGWADHARYNPADESFLLTGSPRLSDAGSLLTADRIQLHRRTGTALGQGNVKTTYNQPSQLDGAMLASSDPIHVTGSSVYANLSPRTARFTSARFWRGADIVQAPVIVFDRDRRALNAQGNQTEGVASVFVQTDKNGKTTPVHVTADHLTYDDAGRKAVYNGHVLVRTDGATIMADRAEALLAQRGAKAESGTASQLEKIVAEGAIQIQQTNRKASGRQLVYAADQEKFVLTGSLGDPPSIFDAERGWISGDSLTFFTHDGRVLVGSGEPTHNPTSTKVQDAGTK